MKMRINAQCTLGPSGPGIAAAMQAGLGFLRARTCSELLALTGRRIGKIPAFKAVDKSALPDSYGGSHRGRSDDFLVGYGLFYLSEQRKLYLDGTSGHYQMLWGYGQPAMEAALTSACRLGVTWDNHSNIPQAPLKWLAHRLVELGNAPEESDRLDTVLLGVCTGSVACGAALKIQLRVFEERHGRRAVPVLVTLDGNYHGTDMVPQTMRGMWPGMMRRPEVVRLPPNNVRALESAFRKHGSRIAGFWAEPVMMNREALAVDLDYLRLAQDLCRATGALLCLDEIQTGFWQPEIFQYRALGLQPDLVVLGKGMTAGFHPLSGVLFRSRHDVLEQYDAISTNGSAALPAWMALTSMRLMEERAASIRATACLIEKNFRQLAVEFPKQIEAATGRGHLSGLKFHQVDDAKRFHRQLLDRGVWTRVHAYHPGHRTVLTKLGLLADAEVVTFLIRRMSRLLRKEGR